MNLRKYLIGCLSIFYFSACQTGSQKALYQIRIVDDQTNRGIPMVQIKTLNAISYYTDNNGYIAFSEPDLMDMDLYFQLESAGYQYPMDETGRPGVSLRVLGGQDTVLKMRRLNIAERLYRSTGTGRNISQQVLGKEMAGDQDKIKAGVLGQDSNLAKPYRGKIFWVWGDTFLPDQYRGNFSVAAAWTSDPRTSSWSAENGVDFSYLTDDRGWSKRMIHLDGPGYVWFDFLMTISSDKEQKLIAKYARVNALFGNYERGIAIYNDDKEIFEKHQQVDAWIEQYHTTEHPFLMTVAGEPYYYLTSEFDFSRVEPRLEAVGDPGQYQHYTCLLPGERAMSERPNVERDRKGNLEYSWKKNTESINTSAQNRLVELGIIAKNEGLIQTVDFLSGLPVQISRGSIFWNEYRQRWILITGNQDIWYGEGDTPTGPWVYLRKVATHKQYLYNPVHHDFLDEKEGRRIFFEGTFTKFFSQEAAIPRYEYNQLMYGVNLEDEHLFLPVPVYQLNKLGQQSLGLRSEVISDPAQLEKISFFALDRKIENEAILPIYQNSHNRLVKSNEGQANPLFYAISSDFSAASLFKGSWEFKISFKSFDNATSLILTHENERWKIRGNKPSFEFSHLSILEDTIHFDLSHEGDIYHLSGTLEPGVIKGSFTNPDQGIPAGPWEAIKTTETWWTPMSKHLVDLYEHEHADGTFSYTTSQAEKNSSNIIISRILCKVWSNPYKNVPFDFSAEHRKAE